MPQGVCTFGKFGAKRRKVYLAELREGKPKPLAAKLAGVSYELVRLYRKAHPGFAELEVEAELSAIGRVEHALFTAATQGNLRAIEYWLCNRDPERWQKNRTVNVDPDALAVLARRWAHEVFAELPPLGRGRMADYGELWQT